MDGRRKNRCSDWKNGLFSHHGMAWALSLSPSVLRFHTFYTESTAGLGNIERAHHYGMILLWLDGVPFWNGWRAAVCLIRFSYSIPHIILTILDVRSLALYAVVYIASGEHKIGSVVGTPPASEH